MLSQTSLKLSSFLNSVLFCFLFSVSYFSLLCRPAHWISSFLSLICCWFHLLYFLFQWFYPSALSLFIFSSSLLKTSNLSFCLFSLLPSTLSIFKITTLNSLLGSFFFFPFHLVLLQRFSLGLSFGTCPYCLILPNFVVLSFMYLVGWLHFPILEKRLL